MSETVTSPGIIPKYALWNLTGLAAATGIFAGGITASEGASVLKITICPSTGCVLYRTVATGATIATGMYNEGGALLSGCEYVWQAACRQGYIYNWRVSATAPIKYAYVDEILGGQG